MNYLNNLLSTKPRSVGLPSSVTFALTLILYLWGTSLSLSAQEPFIKSNPGVETISPNCYKLTIPITYGGIWYINKVNLNFNFNIQGTLNFGTNDSNGADGMGFVFQPLSNIIGNTGMGLGFGGISPSLAVEFDTYQNFELNDPVNDHMGLIKNGDLHHNGPGNLIPPVDLGNIEDGQDHPFIIDWNATSKTLQVTLDGIVRINHTIDIVADVFNGENKVFWGFTASTGAFFNPHTVCFTSSQFVEHTAITWTDYSVNNDWNDPNNWYGGNLPSQNDEVVFNGATPRDANITAPVVVKKVEINEDYNGTVKLLNQSTLTTKGGFIVKKASAFDAGTGKVKLADGQEVKVASELHDVEMEASDKDRFDLLQNLKIKNNLKINNQVALKSPGGAVVQVNGDVTIEQDMLPSTNTVLSMRGTGTQMLKSTENSIIEIEKTSGQVKLQANSRARNVRLNSGTLDLNNRRIRSQETVSAKTNSKLRGRGRVTAPRVKMQRKSRIAPGNSPGLLVIEGDFEMEDEAELEFEIESNAHDTLEVQGTVTLAGDLIILATGTPAGDITVIYNDGTDAVTGTFAGLPEGKEILILGKYYFITYAGGDGNDVVLSPCPPGNVLYVRENASGLNNGSSWTHAFTSLQNALALAGQCSSVTEIWVAAGTYKPDQGAGYTPGNRNHSFVMKNNLAIYGGFNGTETQLSQRNWAANVTTLSGDIGTPNNNSDNSYNVIFNNHNGLDNTAVLDGFKITGGNADGFYPKYEGGGMYNRSSSPTVINCSFSGNSAYFGGGIYNHSSSPTVTNCTFSGNSASYGGGTYNSASAFPSFTNCTFAGNSPDEFRYVGGWPTITNSIIWGNLILLNGNISNSIIKGGYNNCNNCPGGNGNVDPLFISTTNLRLQACSPAINAGSNTAVPSGITTDLDGNPRFYNGGTVDMGAYEFQSAPTPVVASCQNPTVILNSGGTANLDVLTLNNGSTGCGTLSYAVDGQSNLDFTCTDVGENTYTLTVTDSRGLTATCSSTVTVEDNEHPEITPGAIAACYPTVQEAEAAALAATTATDNCTVTLSASTVGACNAQITVTATDEDDNSVFTVYQTNIGVTAPVLANLPTGSDLSCNPTLPVCDENVTASNECGNVDVSCSAGNVLEDGCFRSQTFTYTAFDECSGLSTSSEVTYTWTVVTAPVLANLPTGSDLGCNPTLPVCDENVTASNECGNVDVSCSTGNVLEDGCFRSQTFTYTAFDECSGLSTSSEVTYTWTVVTAPVLANLPTGSDLGCNPTLPVCDENVTASNECGNVDVSCSAGNILEDGCNRSQTFTYTATDECSGLSTSSEVTYTWNVVTAPVLANLPTGSNLGNNPTLPVCDENVTASNECGSVDVSCSAGNILEDGCNRSQTFTYTALDECSGLSASSEVTYTWQVLTAVAISNCPGNITVYSNEGNPASCAQTATWTVPAAVDDCGTALSPSSQSHAPGATFNIGTTPVTYTFTDAVGNTATCSFNVTIIDNTLPTITCPAPVTVNNDPGQCSAVVSYTVTGSDNCSYTLAQTGGIASGSVFPFGTTTNSWKVTDASNNIATCTFTVTVNKSGDPGLLWAYTAIGLDEVKMKQNTVQSGGVGVVNAGKKAKLESGTMVTAANTFVKAPVLELNGGSQVTAYHAGPVNINLLPAFIAYNGTCSNNLNLPDNSGPVTLNLACYRDITVGKNVSVTFSGHGTVNVRELKLKEGASVSFAQNTNVLIDKKLDADKSVTVSNGGQQVWIFTGDHVKVDDGSSITANIYSQKHIKVEKTSSGNPTWMTGLFIAEKIDSKDNVFWNWDANTCPFSPPMLMQAGILQFNAVGQTKGGIARVDLSWVTNEDTQNEFYEVEKTLDGVTFQPVLEQNSRYNDDQVRGYQNLDPNPAEGDWRYRLKVTRRDGTTAYSELRRVILDLPGDFTVFPNPASDRLNVALRGFEGKQALLQIVNGQGVVLEQQEFDSLPEEPVSFDLHDYRDGMYFIHVQVEGKRSRVLKFVVAKSSGTQLPRH